MIHSTWASRNVFQRICGFLDISAYQTVLNNIYFDERDVDGHVNHFLEEIELEDNLKLHASVWEVDMMAP